MVQVSELNFKYFRNNLPKGFPKLFEYIASCECHITSYEGNEVNQQRLGIRVICYLLAYLTACQRKSAEHQKTILVSLCEVLYVVVHHNYHVYTVIFTPFSLVTLVYTERD